MTSASLPPSRMNHYEYETPSPACGEDCDACNGRGVVWLGSFWDACPVATALAEMEWREREK